jgi:Tfp pilus assembly protein FimT
VSGIPRRFEDAETVRRRRMVQAADRLRAQLQSTTTAAVEAGQDIPAEVDQAVRALDRWCREILQLPPDDQ